MTRIAVFTLIAALAAAHAQAQTVVIVRHGEKAAPSGDPDLSGAGQARARDLAAALAGAKVSAVLATNLKRTQQTAKPTADAAGLQMVLAAVDAPTHAQQVAAKARQAPAGSTVLIVGHSDTVGAIARALGDPAPTPITDCDYDRMTIIRLDGPGGPKTIHVRYGAPTQSC